MSVTPRAKDGAMTEIAFTTQDEIERDVALIDQLVSDLDRETSYWPDDEPVALDRAVLVYRQLTQARSDLGLVLETLANRIGDAMGTYTMTLPEVATVTRHKNTKRRNWDSEALLTAVLDTRRFDPEGTVIEETPLDRVRHVWSLAGYSARTGALKARGIDVDEFSESETRGWSLEIKGATKP